MINRILLALIIFLPFTSIAEAKCRRISPPSCLFVDWTKRTGYARNDCSSTINVHIDVRGSWNFGCPDEVVVLLPGYEVKFGPYKGNCKVKSITRC